MRTPSNRRQGLPITFELRRGRRFKQFNGAPSKGRKKFWTEARRGGLGCNCVGDEPRHGKRCLAEFLHKNARHATGQNCYAQSGGDAKPMSCTPTLRLSESGVPFQPRLGE